MSICVVAHTTGATRKRQHYLERRPACHVDAGHTPSRTCARTAAERGRGRGWRRWAVGVMWCGGVWWWCGVCGTDD